MKLWGIPDLHEDCGIMKKGIKDLPQVDEEAPEESCPS